MLPAAHLYPQPPLILAHRGASAYAPENTLAAFRLALEARSGAAADGFELDVTLSADGVPVVIHDDTVDRTTEGTGRVGDMTLAQLRKLEAGLPARFGPQYAGERIPTLDEVFAEFGPRGAIINVELKEDVSPGLKLAERVVELIHAHGMAQRVLLSSFYYDNLQRVRGLDPALPAGLLYDPTEPGRILQAWFGPGLQPQAHHPHYGLVNAWTLRLYRARGLRVNAWTVNRERDMARLIRAGVDGLITDYADVAVRARQRQK